MTRLPDPPQGGKRVPRVYKAPNFSQIPNEIFDELMAGLSGAEFKVLSYIARRTYGFHRIEDSINLKQICDGIVKVNGTRLDHGTGLAKSTAITAVTSLATKGLIAVQRKVSDEKGFESNTYCILVEEEKAVSEVNNAEEGGLSDFRTRGSSIFGQALAGGSEKQSMKQTLC